MRFSIRQTAVSILSVVIWLSAVAVGQFTESTLRGQVVDSQGEAVIAAPLSIRNLKTGQARTAQSGPDGNFLLAGRSFRGGGCRPGCAGLRPAWPRFKS